MTKLTKLLMVNVVQKEFQGSFVGQNGSCNIKIKSFPGQF